MEDIENLVYSINRTLKQYESSPIREGILHHLKSRRSSFWDYKDKKCRYHNQPNYYKYFKAFLRKNISGDWYDVKTRLIQNTKTRYKSNLNMKWLSEDIKDIESFNVYSGSRYSYKDEFYIDNDYNLSLLTTSDRDILLYEGKSCSISSRKQRKKPSTEVFEYKNGFVIEKTKGIYYLFIEDLDPSYYDKTFECEVYFSYERRHKTKQLNKKELKYFNLKND